MRWLIFAFLNVVRNRRRSLLTITIAAVAMAAILTSSGFALFTYHSLAQKAARDDGNLIFTNPHFFVDQAEHPMQYGLSNIGALSAKLKQSNDVEAVLPRISFSGLVSNGNKTSTFIGLGVKPAEFQVKGPFLNLTAGKVLNGKLGRAGLPEIVLAKGVAHSMNVKPGDGVTLLATTTDGALNAVDCVVRGVYTTGVPELDKHQLYVNLATAKALLNTKKVSTLSVYLFDINKTAEKLAKYTKLAPHLLVTPWWKRAFYYDSVRSLYNRIFGLLGIILVLLVFFSISNTMGMTVTERTREIGTVSAMGAYRREIIRNFALEATIIGGAGALLGALLAALISWGVLKLGIQMPPPPGSSQGYPLVIDFSTPLAVAVGAILTLICILASLKAAHRGCRMTITEALSHV